MTKKCVTETQNDKAITDMHLGNHQSQMPFNTISFLVHHCFTISGPKPHFFSVFLLFSLHFCFEVVENPQIIENTEKFNTFLL